MKIQVSQLKSGTKIAVEGELTIYHVAEAMALVDAKLEANDKAVILNLAKVVEVDTAGVQWIVYLQKRLGSLLSLEQCSEPLQQAFSILQLEA